MADHFKDRRPASSRMARKMNYSLTIYEMEWGGLEMTNLTELKRDLKTLQKMALKCQELIRKTRALEARCVQALKQGTDRRGAT
jgi:hypothetical protein